MSRYGSPLQPDMICPKPVKSSIKRLEQDIHNCQLCLGLNMKQVTESAPGYGMPQAELMVVGQSLHGWNPETPNRQIPFVGPSQFRDSGKILFECLRQAEYTIRAGNVFITNVVKCHPPHNRQSRTSEIINCTPFLRRELDEVKPAIILIVGSSACHWFLKQDQIVPQLRGEHHTIYIAQTSHKSHIRYIKITHPSTLLRFYRPGVEKAYIRDVAHALLKAHKSVEIRDNMKRGLRKVIQAVKNGEGICDDDVCAPIHWISGGERERRTYKHKKGTRRERKTQ